MIPGLREDKMSSSALAQTKILFLDSADVINDKIAGAHVEQGDISRNVIMAIFQHIIFPLRSLGIPVTDSVEVILVDGSVRQYSSYEGLEEDFLKRMTDIGSLRSVVAGTLNRILEPVRQEYEADEEWQSAEELAYSVRP